MYVEVGQRWRSVGDGYVIEVIDRAAAGWHVRFGESGITTIVDDDDILDPAQYEGAHLGHTVCDGCHVRSAATGGKISEPGRRRRS